MLKEDKIKNLIEEELRWLEAFATREITNIYRNDLLEVDRRIHRASALYEVLEVAPSNSFLDIVDVIKNKIQKL